MLCIVHSVEHLNGCSHGRIQTQWNNVDKDKSSNTVRERLQKHGFSMIQSIRFVIIQESWLRKSLRAMRFPALLFAVQLKSV